ncbi:general stress protein [Nocardioides hwasunensis]|nr:general stress protein [Nocardioides hwasunensis]
MSTPGVNPMLRSGSPFTLKFPQSLAVYDDYAAAQKSVDFLSDAEFPVEHLMIVGTDLKRIERVTGRLTWSKVGVGGILSGLWLGVFIGLVFALFTEEGVWQVLLTTAFLGATFGLVWALIGYGATRGQRDFSSVTQVVATKYEVLVEHTHAARARELLAGLPGALPNPFV